LRPLAEEPWANEDGAGSMPPTPTGMKVAKDAPLLISALHDELGKLKSEQSRPATAHGALSTTTQNGSKPKEDGTTALPSVHKGDAGVQPAPPRQPVDEFRVDDVSLWEELGIAPPADPLAHMDIPLEDDVAVRRQGRHMVEERARNILHQVQSVSRGAETGEHDNGNRAFDFAELDDSTEGGESSHPSVIMISAESDNASFAGTSQDGSACVPGGGSTTSSGDGGNMHASTHAHTCSRSAGGGGDGDASDGASGIAPAFARACQAEDELDVERTDDQLSASELRTRYKKTAEGGADVAPAWTALATSDSEQADDSRSRLVEGSGSKDGWGYGGEEEGERRVGGRGVMSLSFDLGALKMSTDKMRLGLQKFDE
jgi:hypothetical protein